MNLQFLTPKLHGALDYIAAATLIVAPFALNLGADSALALWLSVTGGFGLIAYSLATDYNFGPFKLLPYNTHLLLDSAAAGAFLIAPFAFGFGMVASIYYFVMAWGVIGVVAVSAREEKEQVQTVEA